MEDGLLDDVLVIIGEVRGAAGLSDVLIDVDVLILEFCSGFAAKRRLLCKHVSGNFVQFSASRFLKYEIISYYNVVLNTFLKTYF